MTSQDIMTSAIARKGSLPMPKLPRDVPVDPTVGELLRSQFIGVELAAEITGVHRNTILRHLRLGSLDGVRVGDKKWLVRRFTVEEVPAIDMWEPGKPGNPNWTPSQGNA